MDAVFLECLAAVRLDTLCRGLADRDPAFDASQPVGLGGLAVGVGVAVGGGSRGGG